MPHANPKVIAPMRCPLCGLDSPACDWTEVDVGVGTQYGEVEYECPRHGPWAPVVPYDMWSGPMRYVFRHGPEVKFPRAEAGHYNRAAGYPARHARAWKALAKRQRADLEVFRDLVKQAQMFGLILKRSQGGYQFVAQAPLGTLKVGPAESGEKERMLMLASDEDAWIAWAVRNDEDEVVQNDDVWMMVRRARPFGGGE